jgi:hypothetical protein
LRFKLTKEVVVNGSFLQVGALLGVAAIIATAHVAAAAANGDQSVRPDRLITCTKTKACIDGTNLGSGPGVQGLNSGSGIGLDGWAYNNDGVNGTTINPSSIQRGRSGVYGADASTGGFIANAGVSGSSNTGLGVWGSSTNHWGVFGVASGDGRGVFAESNNGVSLAASPTSSTEMQTIQSLGGTSNDGNHENLDTRNDGYTESFVVFNDSHAQVNGLLYTLGVCSGGCARTRGARMASYAAQSSMPILQDIGEAKLIGGHARVNIDPSLAQAIDERASYLVEISAEGPSHGLYVADRTATSFRVVENDDGHSTIPFGYRIVATPQGSHAARLPIITPAQMPRGVRPVRAPHNEPRSLRN